MEFKITGSCDEQTLENYRDKGIRVDHCETSWEDKEDIVQKVKGYDCWLNFGQVVIPHFI